VIAKLIFLSLVYWVFALFIAYVAVFAPCGIVPGAWCEEQGPDWFGAVLGFLGPIGVLICAAVIYVLAMWQLVVRRRKRQH
jgi:hypothetical protein